MQHPASRRTSSAAILLLALFVATPLCAAVVASSWTGAGDASSWSDASNWSPAVVPDNGADTYNVTIGGSAIVTVNGTFAISSIAIGGSATVVIPETGELDLSANSTIDGLLRLNDGDSSSGNRAVLGVGTLTISGTGTIRADTANFQNVIEDVGSGNVLTIGSGISVTTASGAILRFIVDTTVNGSMTAADGRIVLDAAVANGGAIAANNGTVRIGPGHTLTGGGGTITLDATGVLELAGTVADETIGGSGTIDADGALAKLSNSTLNGVTALVAADDKLTLAGPITNDGTIRLADADPDTGNRAVVSVLGALTIGGTGQIVFDSAEFQNVFEPAAGGSTLTIGSGQTVTTTAGSIGRFIVDTTIDGSLTAANGTIVFDAAITNNGTVAANNGTVRVGPGHTLTGGGGTITLDPTGILDLLGIVADETITGSGTIDADGALAKLSNSTLDGVTALVEADDTLTLIGPITNNGTIRLADADPDLGNRALVSVLGALTIGGTGQIVFDSAEFQNVFGPAAAGSTLTIGPGQTIMTTPGSIGRFIVDLSNQGTMEATGGTIVIDSAMSNEGMAVAGAGGVIHVGPGHSLTNESSGTITGSGTFEIDPIGSLTNLGTISPGPGIQTLTIDGSVTFNDGSLLEIEVTGSGSDQLVVTGTANIGGNLGVRFEGPPVPDPADTFVFLTAATVSGVFSNADPGSGTEATLSFAGGTFDVVYETSSVALTNYAAALVPATTPIGLAALALLLAIAATTLLRRQP